MKYLTDIRSGIDLIAKEYELSLVVLFGSHATNTTHAHSDVDVAYFSKHPLMLAQESRLIIELARLFQSERIDLVSLRGASPLLLREIATKGKPLYEVEPSFFDEFYFYALRQFQESAPLFRLRSLQVKTKIEQYKR